MRNAEINLGFRAMSPQGRAAKERKGEIVCAAWVKVEGESLTTSQKNAITPFRRHCLRDDRKWAMPGTTHLYNSGKSILY